MSAIFLTCIHNRRTDDKLKAFTSEQAAMNYLRQQAASDKNYDGAEESTRYFGDWCLYISDDFYMSVQKIELV